MQSVKITSEESRRWYDDACGTALALEFVGERWALLIMRELFFGPRRFGELKATLPGISANVLTRRLTGLEQAAIVEKRLLPSPANVQVYDLTPWGRESEPIFQEMGRWATRSPLHDATLYLSPASAMMSLRTMIARRREDLAMTLMFRFPRDSFAARLTPDDLVIRRGEDDHADATFACEPTTLAAIVYGKWPIEAAEADGALTFAGDHALADRFLALFAMPEKIGQ